MGSWGRRVASGCVVASAMIIGSKTWAQSAGCTAVNGVTITITVGSSWGTPSNFSSLVFTAGETITVTVTATGGTFSGSLSPGGATYSGSQPNTRTVTATTTGTKSLTGGGSGHTAGGTATYSCGSSGSGSSSGSSSTAAAAQTAQNAGTAISNGVQSINQQGVAITNGVSGGLATPAATPGGGAKPCPTCDRLRSQISDLRDRIKLNETRIDAVRRTQADLVAREQAIADNIDRIKEGRDAAVSRRDDTRARELTAVIVGLERERRVVNETRTQTDARERNLGADIALDQGQIKNLENALRAAEAEAQSSSLPHSDWRRGDALQSLRPRQTTRESMPDELFSLDGRDKPAAPSAFRFGTEDLIQLAQAPDGANALREKLGGKWNVWGEGRLTGVNDTVAASSGLGFVGNIGVDYKFQPWLAAGMSGGVETFESKFGSAGGRTGTVGLSAVPYVGVRLDPNIFFSGFVGLTSIGYDSNPRSGVNARFNATRVFVGGGLSGTWQDGPWRFQPSVSISYGSETQASYTDSSGTAVPGQTVQFGRAAAGPEVGYTFRADDGSWSLEPFALARANLDFATDTRVFLNGLYVTTRSNASGAAASGSSRATASPPASRALTIRSACPDSTSGPP